MTGFDVGVAAVLMLFALRGYRRGMGRELISVLTIVASVWVAALAAPSATAGLAALVGERLSGLLAVVVVAGVYLVAYTGLRFVLAVVRRLWISVGVSAPSRLAGTVIGALKGAALAGLMVALVEGAPPFEGTVGSLPAPAERPVKAMSERVSGSLLAPSLAGLTGQVVSALIAVGRSTTSQARTYTSGAS